MSTANRCGTHAHPWIVVPLIIVAGVVAAFLWDNSRDQPDATIQPAAESPVTSLQTTPAPYPVREAPPASAQDQVRTQAVDNELRTALTVQDYADVESEAPTSWAAFMQKVEVQGEIILATLDLESDDPHRGVVAENAALAISVILPADFVQGISWVVVQDASGNELARAEPMPADVDAPPSLGFLG